MPALKNPRYELFAQGLAKGLSSADAYSQAGFKSEAANAAGANGSRLRNKPQIIARLEELLLQGARKAEVKAADVIQMLLEDRELARELKQMGAAIRADELLGKSAGLFIDRRELRIGLLDDLSPAQLEAIREAALLEEARRRQEMPQIEFSEPKLIEFSRTS